MHGNSKCMQCYYFVKVDLVVFCNLENSSSFIQAISLAPLQVRYYSEVLPTQHGYCARVSHRGATGNCNRQLQVKNLPKVPTWRLEWDSNPQPSGRKASTLSMRHHVPQINNNFPQIFIYLLSIMGLCSCI